VPIIVTATATVTITGDDYSDGYSDTIDLGKRQGQELPLGGAALAQGLRPQAWLPEPGSPRVIEAFTVGTPAVPPAGTQRGTPSGYNAGVVTRAQGGASPGIAGRRLRHPREPRGTPPACPWD